MTTPDPTLQSAERRLLAFLCVVLAVLQILDLHSTLLAARLGRDELNPSILWLVSHLGFMPAVVAFKAMAVALITFYYLVVSTFKRMLWPAISLVPVCAAYVTVVINNYS